MRKIQHWLGRASALFLFMAMLALADGLIAKMRTGANELELLPGHAEAISGPSPLKHPLNSDLVAAFTPADAPLRFIPEGFFSGYWFGSGMWRGKVEAAEGAATGAWTLRISFKGASAQTAQVYIVRLFADRAAWRAASLSLLRRWLDIPPFPLAAACGCAGILLGVFTYIFGRRHARALARLGLAEVYGADGARIWCLVPAALAPSRGNARMIIDQEGKLLGEARAEEWKKGKLLLTLLDGAISAENALVCLAPPGMANKNNPDKHHGGAHG